MLAIDCHFFFRMPEQSSIFDEIVRVLVVSIAAYEHADIVQHGCRPEQVQGIFTVIVQFQSLSAVK